MIPLPASWFGLAFLIALVVPGLVYTSVKAAMAGSRDVDASTLARVLQAVVVSAIFDALWALVLIPMVHINPLADPRATIIAHPRAAAALFLGCGVLAPALVAWILHGAVSFLDRPRQYIAAIWTKFTGSAHASTPTAWDFALEQQGGTWVRVRLADGRWVGGVWDAGSYASTFPRPRDLFISEQWEIDARGVFGAPVANSRGLWISVNDEYIVEFLADADADAAAVAPDHSESQESA